MLNDLFRTYKKIILMILLLLCSVVFWFYGCRHQTAKPGDVVQWKKVSSGKQSGNQYQFQTGDFSGTVSFGTGKYLSAEETVPVVLSLKCTKKSFTGLMKITLPGDSGKGIAWQSAVKCQKGSSSKVVLYVPQLGNPSMFTFELLDSFGTMKLSETVTPKKASQEGESEAGDDSETSLWYIKKALYGFRNSQLPNTFYYGVFFICYLLMIVMIAYYYLRKIRRREYIWVVVPALSIFFTGILLIRSMGIAGGNDGSLSALRIMDTEKKEEVLYFLCQSEEGENRNIQFLPSVTSVTPLDYHYKTDGEAGETVNSSGEDFTINNTSRGYDIDFKEAVPGTSRLLKLARNTTNLSADDSRSNHVFSQKITGSYTAFHGKITNVSSNDFSRVLLIRGNQYAVLRNVEAGKTVSVKDSQVKCWNHFDKDNTEFSKEEENSVTGNIMEYLQQNYLDKEENQEKLLMIGITDNNNFHLFSDENELKNHVTVIVDHFEVKGEQNLGSVSNINHSCLEEEEAGNSSLAEDTLEKKETEAVYFFDETKEISALVRNRDGFRGKIYAYNYQTGERDQILSQWDDCLDEAELIPYLSENKEMVVTYELEGEDYASAPILSLFYAAEETGNT